MTPSLSEAKLFRRKKYIHSPEVQLVIDRIHAELDKWNYSKVYTGPDTLEGYRHYVSGTISISKRTNRLKIRSGIFRNESDYGKGKEGTYAFERFVRMHPSITLLLVEAIEKTGLEDIAKHKKEEQMRQFALDKLLKECK